MEPLAYLEFSTCTLIYISFLNLSGTPCDYVDCYFKSIATTRLLQCLLLLLGGRSHSKHRHMSANHEFGTKIR